MRSLPLCRRLLNLLLLLLQLRFLREVLQFGHLTMHLRHLTKLRGHIRTRVLQQRLQTLHLLSKVAQWAEQCRRRLQLLRRLLALANRVRRSNLAIA